MLDLCDQEQQLVETLGPLKCDLNLPASWEQTSQQTGRLPGRYCERRRYPRYHFRVCAALQYRQTFPILPRPEGWFKVFTNDLSRGGISFLHSEPVFPRERLQIVLPGQPARVVEVIWFTRLQERCFRVGARFVEQSQAFGAAQDQPDPDPAPAP